MEFQKNYKLLQTYSSERSRVGRIPAARSFSMTIFIAVTDQMVVPVGVGSKKSPAKVIIRAFERENASCDGIQNFGKL